ncbi:MAG: hypothetical protein JJE30_06830 [Desulfuromonadales bacterium]|nr:hypothetical protein [Desulfuromonadales bacterium]
MKTVFAIVLSLLITAAQALASVGGSEGEGVGLLAMFFIAFSSLIVIFQLVPGIRLFLGMLKGLFSSAEKIPVDVK